MKIDEKLDTIRDEERLKEIKRLGLDSTEKREILDLYVEKASKEFNLPIALVSIVLDDAQHFVASTGLNGWMAETKGTPIEWSFCANSVQTKTPFIVEDAIADERVNDNPLVTMDGIRCYAGAPMISSRNVVVGNFCVIGDNSRTFSEEEIGRVKEYAKQAMIAIEQVMHLN